MIFKIRNRFVLNDGLSRKWKINDETSKYRIKKIKINDLIAPVSYNQNNRRIPQLHNNNN